MYCSKCGIAIAEDDSFCRRCGTSLLSTTKHGIFIKGNVTTGGGDFIGRDFIKNLRTSWKNQNGCINIVIVTASCFLIVILLGTIGYENSQIQTGARRLIADILKRIEREVSPPTPVILPRVEAPLSQQLVRGLKATSDSPVIAGTPVSFLATVIEGTDVIYSWNFGDGQSNTGAAVSHVYSTPGRYIITLSAVNESVPVTTTTQVEILDAPPKGLRIEHTTPLALNDTVYFTATIESGTNVQYQWSISEGTTFNGPHLVYLFTKTGNYEVGVLASNGAGSISVTTTV